MKNCHAPRLVGLAACGTILSAPALARDRCCTSGGVSASQSRTDIDAGGPSTGLLPGVAAASSSTDNKDTAFQVFGGGQFSCSTVLEGGYFWPGENRFTAVTATAGTLPRSECFSALARACPITPSAVTPKRKYSLGMQYAISPVLLLRGEMGCPGIKIWWASAPTWRWTASAGISAESRA